MKRALIASALLVGCLVGWIGLADDQPLPHPELTAPEVVRIQLDAMAHNDDPMPNAGIATAFRFASPDNRRLTGPLDRFTAMVRGESYRDLLDHRSAELLSPMETPAHTLVPVRLVSRDGVEVRYLFVLTRQGDGDCSGCWMTDAVMPVDRPEPRNPII